MAETIYFEDLTHTACNKSLSPTITGHTYTHTASKMLLNVLALTFPVTTAMGHTHAPTLVASILS